MAKQKQTAEQQFLEKWNEYGFPNSDIESQYKFSPERQWRLDFAFPSRRVGIEVDGRAKQGSFGGHQSVVGVRRDCQKANTAIKLGWVILRIPTSDIAGKNEWGESLLLEFIELINDVLTQRGTHAIETKLDQGVDKLPEVPTPLKRKTPRPLSGNDSC